MVICFCYPDLACDASPCGVAGSDCLAAFVGEADSEKAIIFFLSAFYGFTLAIDERVWSLVCYDRAAAEALEHRLCGFGWNVSSGTAPAYSMSSLVLPFSSADWSFA